MPATQLGDEVSLTTGLSYLIGDGTTTSKWTWADPQSSNFAHALGIDPQTVGEDAIQ